MHSGCHRCDTTEFRVYWPGLLAGNFGDLGKLNWAPAPKFKQWQSSFGHMDIQLTLPHKWWVCGSWNSMQWWDMKQGQFTHKTESPWPFYSKHSHWWKRRSLSKFASHYSLRDEQRMWMQSLHRFLHGIEWIMVHGHLDYVQKPPLEGRPNTKLGDHGTPNVHNHWFEFCHVWGPA